nr:unnamed protein product [Callosobruchus chinensis]
MPFLKKHSTLVSRSRRLENMTKKNGLRHKIFSVNGDTYVGEWQDDKRTGKGVKKTYQNQRLYEGDFVDSVRHGFGVLADKIPGIDVYELYYVGEWFKGMMEGFGRWVLKGKGLYLGEFHRGKRHGYGKMWFEDGSYYEGEWIKGKRHGQGMLIYQNGNRYEGNFLNDLKHGRGRFYFLNVGQLQEGVWAEDVCIFSQLYNLPYRQTAKRPNVFPMERLGLVYPDAVCEEQEFKALKGIPECNQESDMMSFLSYNMDHLGSFS